MHTQTVPCYAWLMHQPLYEHTRTFASECSDEGCQNQLPSACRNLSGNPFEGPLPVEWGLNSTWPRLTSLSLNANPSLESDLPTEWATSGGFQQLKVTTSLSARYQVEGPGRVSSEVCSSKAVRDFEHAPFQHREQRPWPGMF